MTDHTVDVLIVGAGPAGTTLAIDMARRGRTIRIIDAAAHAFAGSRAKGVQPRTLEVLDDLGALDHVLAGGGEYPLLGIHVGPLTFPWRMFKNVEPTDQVPYPNTWLIPQFRTDQALHTRLRDFGHEVEYGHRLVAFTQDTRSVTATVAVGAGIETVTARYLVGADGGASTVRKQLGVGFVGSTDETDRILIVDAKVTGGLRRDRWHVWPGLRGRFVGACPIPDSELFQWVIRLGPEEQPPEGEAAITDHIREHTRNKRLSVVDIVWKSLFRTNTRLAEHYGRGRAFLVGDAAHVHPPAGAQGLNTGIGDAYNLGWKLAQVLDGADPTLLDSYELERRPIAAAVLGLATRKYDAVGQLDPASIRRGTDEQQLKLTYHGGPLAPSETDRTTTVRVGDRAPDAVLRDRDGTPVRMFDMLRGPHFTAIAYGANAAEDLDELAWPETGAPLRRIITGATAELADNLLVDDRASFASAYGLPGDALLLVRPDGYIGHIATREMAASTRDAAQLLTLRYPVPSGRRHQRRHLTW